LSERIVLASGDGERVTFLGNLATIKAGREATGSWGLVEVTAPAGYETPRHVHEEEDEVFYVLEGELTISIGADSFSAREGAFALSHLGIPHAIKAERDTRWLHLASSGRFIDLIRDIGVPATEVLPSASPADFDRLRERAPEHGIVFLDDSGPGRK
jgi:quercetin dioxygenase-like cupin family protein